MKQIKHKEIKLTKQVSIGEFILELNTIQKQGVQIIQA